ncbi:MAG: RsmE family RNA methyltransferase [Isosphaeraceae bacterium]
MSVRFYCPDPPRDGRFQLPADEARHLAKVCRHGPGDVVELFDGKGLATSARVLEVGRDRVVLAAEGAPLVGARAGCEITLASAVPKGDRFDVLVEKATELGAARLIPLITERSVVEPSPSKLERLRRTVIEACKQCRRADLMELAPPVGWAEFVRSTVSPGGNRLLALQSGRSPAAWPTPAAGVGVLLAVGPEGGFSPPEVELAEGSGWVGVCLAPHVLRIETAGIAGIAAILAKTEKGGGDGVD